jgi:hypothetical protein
LTTSYPVGERVHCSYAYDVRAAAKDPKDPWVGENPKGHREVFCVSQEEVIHVD